MAAAFDHTGSHAGRAPGAEGHRIRRAGRISTAAEPLLID
jgi:hypothetical protein